MSHLLAHALHHRTKAETAEQIRRAQAGDRTARDQVIRQHLHFLVAEVNRWTAAPEMVEDLEAEAMLGLNRAIDLFETKRNLAFLTYALPWIRTHIRRAIVASPIVRGPMGEAVDVARARRTGRCSLDTSSHVDGLALKDVLHAESAEQPEALVSAAELRHRAEQDVERAMEGLTPLQVDVVRRRILAESPETLVELGDRHGLSRESIRQQEVKAMRHLRERLRAHRSE